MKKLVMLAVAILGTTAMVSAQTTPAQTAPAKEAKVSKKEKKADKKASTLFILYSMLLMDRIVFVIQEGIIFCLTSHY